VDFDLEGRDSRLVRENSAGKSTLMKVLIGINPRFREIHYLGRSSIRGTPSMRWRWGSGSTRGEMMDRGPRTSSLREPPGLAAFFWTSASKTLAEELFDG
jgi:ABC-type cobalamin/Fe3+-siderophores transport system ATPase subunit